MIHCSRSFVIVLLFESFRKVLSLVCATCWDYAACLLFLLALRVLNLYWNYQLESSGQAVQTRLL